MAMIGAGMLTSCDDTKDFDGYTEYDGKDTKDIFFPSTTPTSYKLNPEGGTITLTLMRSDNADEVTVPITVQKVSDDDDEVSAAAETSEAITIPTSVTFPAGSSSANINITYVSFADSGLEYDEAQDYILSISSSYQSVFAAGDVEIEISMVYPSPWTTLGMAKYTDYFIGTFFGVDDLTYELEISENDLTPGLYRLLNPYGEAYPENDPGDWDDTQDYYLYLNASDPDKVFISDASGNPAFFYSGLDWGYGEFVMTTFASYYLRNGNEASAEPYYGTMTDGVIYIATNSTLTAMMDYNNGGLYPRSDLKGPAVWVVLPGATVEDASVNVIYGGILHNVDGSLSVVAEVELGTDADSAKVAVVKGSIPTSEQLEAIEDGSIESQTITSSGTINLPFDVNNTEGVYTLVAISYVGSEERSTGTASFNYIPTTSEWGYVNSGTYTYLTDMWGEEDDEIIEDVLDLYESETTPGKYKLADWMGEDYPLIFYMDSEGIITIPEQETGVNSQYGMIMVTDVYTYNGNPAAADASFYEDGEYYFYVVYYVSAGAFGGGYEYYKPDATTETSKSAVSRSSVSNADRFLKIGKNLTPKKRGIESSKTLKLNAKASNFFVK